MQLQLQLLRESAKKQEAMSGTVSQNTCTAAQKIIGQTRRKNIITVVALDD